MFKGYENFSKPLYYALRVSCVGGCVLKCLKCFPVTVLSHVTHNHHQHKLTLVASALCVSALIAMEMNVTENTLAGESTVLSAADVPLEESHQHTTLKVHDDGRKCFYALSSQEAGPLLLISVAEA